MINEIAYQDEENINDRSLSRLNIDIATIITFWRLKHLYHPRQSSRTEEWEEVLDFYQNRTAVG